MLGLLDDAACRTPSGFQAADDRVFLIGDDAWAGLGGSAYLAQRGHVVGPLPALDLEREQRVQRLCLEAIRRGLIRSAHDLSDGGLGVALAEAAILGTIGLVGEPSAVDEPIRWLFNEGHSRIVVSVRPDAETALRELASDLEVPCALLGTVGGERVTLKGLLDVGLDELARAWKGDEAWTTTTASST
jgi:phosphoribosylformylglycinamidine synthase